MLAARFRFTPDGKSLAFIVTERGVSNLWAVPLTGGEPKWLTDFKSDVIFDFAWSRDGGTGLWKRKTCISYC